MRFALAAIVLLISVGIIAAQSPKSADVPTSTKDRKVHPATRPGQILEISIKELGNFDFDDEKGSPIPDDVSALSGVTIKLHGVMIPMDQADHITKFALIPSDFFKTNKSPPLQQTIVVTCPADKSVNYEAGEIVVQGTLKVEVVKDDGFIQHSSFCIQHLMPRRYTMSMAPSPIIDYGSRKPLSERINFRMLTIIVVFSALIGIPVYSFVKIQLTHGIEKNGSRFDVDLKKMGYFPFNEMTGTLNDVPPDYRKLDGKEVALEGFIFPMDGSGDKVHSFQLVYNIQKCCFSGPPQVQERVFAEVPNNGTVDYSTEEIRAIGTLHVVLNRDSDTGKITKLYTMDVKRVEPL
jgi:hypothetical protein